MASKRAHSLVFCQCGALLDPPESSASKVTCRLCKMVTPASEFDSLEVVTRTRPGAFPAKPKVNATKNEDTMRDGATIRENCPNPKCDATELVFHTAQLRSADEGQTVFRTCLKCGFKDKLNS